MKYHRHLSPGPLLLVTIIIGVLTGCSSNGSGIKISKGFNITCEVFYRSSQDESLSPAPEINFSEGSDHKYLIFDDMTFNARFQDDAYEGKALYINVTGIDDQEEFTRQLYQFDNENMPGNQFVGGHGFTGLHYVYHPLSRSEMQYYCNIE